MAAETAGDRALENITLRHIAGFSRDAPTQDARHGLALVGRKILVGVVEQVEQLAVTEVVAPPLDDRVLEVDAEGRPDQRQVFLKKLQ